MSSIVNGTSAYQTFLQLLMDTNTVAFHNTNELEAWSYLGSIRTLDKKTFASEFLLRRSTRAGGDSPKNLLLGIFKSREELAGRLLNTAEAMPQLQDDGTSLLMRERAIHQATDLKDKAVLAKSLLKNLKIKSTPQKFEAAQIAISQVIRAPQLLRNQAVAAVEISETAGLSNANMFKGYLEGVHTFFEAQATKRPVASIGSLATRWGLPTGFALLVGFVLIQGELV
jgi:hypothetical protein